MITTIKKWGNSQGLRFSKTVLKQADIDVGDEVEIVVERGQIIVKKPTHIRGKYKLEDLIAQLPKDYKPYGEVWNGPMVKETW